MDLEVLAENSSEIIDQVSFLVFVQSHLFHSFLKYLATLHLSNFAIYCEILFILRRRIRSFSVRHAKLH